MKVADIMQCQVVTVTPETSLRSVARVIFSGQIGGLPVVDEKKRLLGIIVEKDVLSLFFPTSQEYIEDYTHASDFELMEEKITEILNLPAHKFMSKNPVVTTPQAPLLKAAALMIAKHVRKLPVVDEKRKLLGIIAQGDIFRILVRRKIPTFKTHPRRGIDFFSRFARYFDISFSWEQRLTEEIPFILSFLKKTKAKTVLDLGCGTGEHAIALAKKGFQVTGIDSNEEMLANAQEKWRKQEEKVRKNLEFLHLPIREIDKKFSGRRFDAAICIGNIIPYLHDFPQELLSLKKVLTPKAVLIIQVRNFARVLSEKERFISLNFSFPETEKEWEKEYAFLRFYAFRSDGLLDFNVETLASDGRAWHSYGVETTLQRPILQRDLTRLFTALKFPKVRFLGNFNFEKYDKDKSLRLIGVAIR